MIQIKDDILLRHLRKLGAPLGTDDTGYDENALTSEEVFVYSLSLARRNPVVARVFPVVIARNRIFFDNFELIKALARKIGEAKTLGFFLELTAELTGKNYFADLANQLSEYKGDNIQDFFIYSKKSKYAQQLEELNTPAVAKRWNFTMNMNKDSFVSIFNKFIWRRKSSGSRKDN